MTEGEQTLPTWKILLLSAMQLHFSSDSHHRVSVCVVGIGLEPGNSEHSTQPFDNTLLAIIVGVAGGILLIVILIVTIGCCLKSRRDGLYNYIHLCITCFIRSLTVV